MARLVASAIGDQPAFKPLGKLDFNFFDIFSIAHRQGRIHDYPVFKLLDILIQHKAAHLIGGFRQRHTGDP